VLTGIGYMTTSPFIPYIGNSILPTYVCTLCGILKKYFQKLVTMFFCSQPKKREKIVENTFVVLKLRSVLSTLFVALTFFRVAT
jgi:hypothetical protein